MAEILIVIAVLAVIGAIASQIIVVSITGNKVASEKNLALGILNETFEAVDSIATEKWQDIYNLTKGSVNYYSQASSTKWVAASGTENINVGGIDFTRYFNVQNVCRETSPGSDGRDITGITDDNGTSATCNTSGGIHDPSTQKITATVNWTTNQTISSAEYISRWRNKVCLQTNWSSAGSSGVKACPDTTYDSAVNLSTGDTLQISQ